jgi:LysM repeat protein
MHCRRCGARLQQGMLICPECGARQRRLPLSIRCAYCHGRIPTGLTVCPHCGRTARPAGPRWGLWAVLTVVVVVVVLWGLGRLPVERARREVIDTRDRLSGLVQVLDIPTSLPATPTTVRVAAVARTPTPVVFPTIVALPTATVILINEEEAGEMTSGTDAITATLTVTATVVLPTVDAIQTTAPTLVATTAVPTATPTPPTSTATPTPSATTRPARASVQPATPTATAQGGGVTYVVKAGDTLAGIGLQFGVPWESIASANNIGSATSLQIGQVLRIPVAGAPLPPTATPRPRATPTPTATATAALPTLPAPVLENPADGSRADGEDAQVELRWQPVPGMPAGALYQVAVEYLQGGQRRTEVLQPTASTGQRFPPWLYGAADQPGRRFTWYVTVVRMTTDGKGGELAVALSPPSARRSFEWQ